MLLGALLVFTVLALTMVLTRKLDWHAIVQVRVPKLPAAEGRSPPAA
jgi:inner membrane protein involved in colicin E2 resistance